MASPSGSEVVQLEAVEQRKRKRMLSNRESARRSRLRKQKHLDELTAQVSRLRKENAQIMAVLHVSRDHYVKVVVENSILRTQVMELSSRLQSLDQILTSCSALAAERSNGFSDNDDDDHNGDGMSPLLAPAWSIMAVNHHKQPVTVTSAHLFHYC